MFATLHRLLENIKVITNKDYITIEGLPSRGYMNDVYALWKTSRIQDYMFTRVTKSSVTFKSFFLPDVLYTLETIVAKPRRGAGTNYRVLRKVVEVLKKETWLKKIDVKQPDILDFKQVQKLNWKLLEQQKNFIRQYNDVVPKFDLLGFLLAAVPGSGKTFAGISLATCLQSDVVICIVPKNAVDRVWVPTIQEVFKKPMKVWSSTSGEEIKQGYQFYVCHYDQLELITNFFRSYHPVNPAILVDESHNFNDPNSLRTTTLVELCRKVTQSRHVLFASGTPIKAVGLEAITLLRCIDPLFDEDVEERFRKIYGRSESKAADILRNRLGFFTFKVEKSEVIHNEVETIVKNIEIPNGEIYTLDVIKEDMKFFVTERVMYYKRNFDLYKSHYDRGISEYRHVVKHRPPVIQHDFEEYQKAISVISKGFDPRTMKDLAVFCNEFEKREIIPCLKGPLREEFINAKSVIKYVDLKIRGEALGRVLGKKRSECHVEMVPHSDLENEIDIARKKTVIFTSYVEVVDAANKYLKKKGYKPALIYGATNKDINAIIKNFEKDEDTNPLIATFQSLSTAVPLVMASTAILMNSPFRSYEYDQATARIDRIGQDGPISIVNVFLKTGEKPNISTRSGDIMEWSIAAVDMIMGENSAVDDVALEDISLESIVEEVLSTKVKTSKDWIYW